MVPRPVSRVGLMFGLFFVLVALILMLAGKLPIVGKLPGDFVIQRGRLTLYLPLASSLLLSLLLTLIVRIFRT